MTNAEIVLDFVRDGSPEWRAAAEDLAAAVLAPREVRLALQLTGGGEVKRERAAQLARLIAGVDQLPREAVGEGE